MVSKSFNGITSEVFASIKSKLSEYGLNLEGHSGSVSKMGVSMDYTYDPDNARLDLNNVDVGFPASFAGYTPEKILDTLQTELTKNGIG